MLPLESISITQDWVRRTTPSFNEHIPFDNTWGSIGITEYAKYELVPLVKASLSKGLSLVT